MLEVLDEDGREVGNGRLVLELARKGGAVPLHGELTRYAIRMEVGERVSDLHCS